MTISELNKKIISGEITDLRYIHRQYGEVPYLDLVQEPGIYYFNNRYQNVVEDEAVN